MTLWSHTELTAPQFSHYLKSNCLYLATQGCSVGQKSSEVVQAALRLGSSTYHTNFGNLCIAPIQWWKSSYVSIISSQMAPDLFSATWTVGTLHIELTAVSSYASHCFVLCSFAPPQLERSPSKGNSLIFTTCLSGLLKDFTTTKQVYNGLISIKTASHATYFIHPICILIWP